MSLTINDTWDIDLWDDLMDSAGSSMANHPRVNESQLVGSPRVEPPVRSTPHGNSSNAELLKPRHALFVKVYMEGFPIGRKLNIVSHDNYDDLIATLSEMFKTTFCRANRDAGRSDKYHVLTYEDKDGDWMMAGDVPWEMFINTVRRLKITRADKC